MKPSPFRHLLISGWLALCLAGTLLFVYHPMLLSGLARVQTDGGDSRFNNYCLEHTYLWLKQAPLHERLWDPPYFAPKTNVAAYSDLLLGVAPLYWPWRLAGIAPDTAFQLWMLSITAANFLVACCFLRGLFRVSLLPASLAAVFFSSANSLIAQVGHQQLICQAYVLGAVAAVFMMFRGGPASTETPPPKKWGPIGLFFSCMTLQFYSAFYFGFFTVMALGVGALCALAVREHRRELLGFCIANRTPILTLGSLAAIAMIPWLIHYLTSADEVGHRGIRNVLRTIPPIQAWFHMGPCNWLYGATADLDLFKSLRIEHEQRLGIGLVTPLACAAGLFLCRHTRGVRLLMTVTVVLMLVLTEFTFLGLPPAWELVYWTVPGATAIGPAGRFGIMIIIPAAIGLASLLDQLFKKRTLFVACAGLAVAAVCLLEQFTLSPAYDKQTYRDAVAKIASAVRPDCKMFLYTESGTNASHPCPAHLSAMWAGIAAGKPTISGYGGNHPPDWQFHKVSANDPAALQKTEDLLHAWVA